jgi:hypothetical protein
MEELAELDKAIDYSENVLFDYNSLTIRERTKDAIFDTHNYKKASKGKFLNKDDIVTGKVLDINRVFDA